MSIPVKVGKFALAAVATAGAGAIGYYAGNGLGTAAAVAGTVAGGFAGATILGAAGGLADISGGFFGTSNHSKAGLLVGGIGGAAAGAFMGATLSSSPLALGLGAVAGVAGLAVTSSATNILAK